MLNKENIGKILFSIGRVMLFIMIFNPLNSFFIHIDEWYTISLIKMSFIDGIKLTAGDVHPPLYYLLVKSVVKILTWLNIPFNLIYVSKIVTLMPYLILLIVSATKVKREYSWLTAGILVFALGTMSEFFIKFITLRMYGWAFIFLLLAFIYFKDVINKSNWKYWMLMTIFSILGAYTHYFIAISVVIMYLLLLIYILFSRDYESNNDFNRKNEVKKWIISVFIGLVSYLPWVPIIITQLNTSNNYWIPSITNKNIIQFLSYFATNSSEDFLKYFAIIFLIVLLTITILKLRNDEIKEKFYLFTGIIMVAGTFLFLLIFSL